MMFGNESAPRTVKASFPRGMGIVRHTGKKGLVGFVVSWGPGPANMSGMDILTDWNKKARKKAKKRG